MVYWQFSVVLVRSCFFAGSRALLVIIGGSWRFLVVPNDFLVVPDGSWFFCS